jgi:hypothetical protein
MQGPISPQKRAVSPQCGSSAWEPTHLLYKEKLRDGSKVTVAGRGFNSSTAARGIWNNSHRPIRTDGWLGRKIRARQRSETTQGTGEDIEEVENNLEV